MCPSVTKIVFDPLFEFLADLAALIELLDEREESIEAINVVIIIISEYAIWSPNFLNHISEQAKNVTKDGITDEKHKCAKYSLEIINRVKIAESNGRERCKSIIHAGHGPTKWPIIFRKVTIQKVQGLSLNDLLEVANYVPEKPQEITCSQNRYDKLRHFETGDYFYLSVDVCVVNNIIIYLYDALLLEVVYPLFKFWVKYSLNILLEFTRAHQIVALADTDNFDGVKQSIKLPNVFEYFSEWYNRYGIIDESSFDIVHGDFV